MARYTNIVSFEDAQAASRRRRIQEASRDQHLSSIKNGPVHYDLSLFATPARQTEDYSDDERPQAAPKPTRASALRLSRPIQIEETTEDTEAPSPSRTQARESRQRERAKARADRMFAEQFGDQDAYGAGTDDAPRAALYEGQMGSNQRKAARMQRASEAGSPYVKIDPAGWFSRISVSPRRMKATTAFLCAILAIVFLYSPAQHYYQSVREHDRLTAEYASIQERNSVLASQNEALASDAGMEDAVRQKYGYVINGEETAIVTGLSEETTASHDDGVEANVLSSSVKAPEEWYTPYLDALFGVS